MSFDLATVLRESTLAHPDKPLLLVGPHVLTYAQVDEMTGRVASGLRAAGLAPGDRIALQLPNVPEFVLTFFGALKAGLTVVPMNPLLKAPEVAYHLTDSSARLLVTHEAFAGEALRGATDADAVRVLVVGAAPEGTEPFDQLLGHPGSDDVEQLGADDTAVVIYTSGTTGRPKGAMLTHFQMYMAATIGGETFGYRD